LVLERLGSACKHYSVDKGLAQLQPAAPPLYVAICHLEFESLDAFKARGCHCGFTVVTADRTPCTTALTAQAVATAAPVLSRSTRTL